MRYIDTLLNKITMYRLALYELIFLLLAASILGFFHLVSYNPLYIAYSVAVIFAVAWVVNKVFAFFYEAPSNPESTWITALILALLISPPVAFGDMQFLALAGWAAAISVASKYIFAIKEKHIFNPAAFGIAATALFLGMSGSWWVGTLWMLPFVVIGGFLLARKIRHLDMVFAFGVALVVTIVTLSISDGSGVLHILQTSLLYSPAIFLATVMLTEPLTTPPTRFDRVIYAALVGFLFAPEIHFGSFYLTPELALLAGNLYAYALSPKHKLILSLKEKIRLSPDTYEFVFSTNRKMKFKPGQYLEWTLPHAHADARGIRRYFTIASSPTDPDIRLGVKFYEPASSFKKALQAMPKGGRIVASQLAGDFVLPKDKKKKMVFIAGGIGVTPFRSMIQYLLDKQDKRDIVMFYSNKTIQDVAYVGLLDRAERELGIETLPVFSNQTPEMLATGEFPAKIDQRLIMESIPDYAERMYYLSGPRGMVDAFSDILGELGISKSHIKKDFFPGFA
jgi:ferredoxin-NADP reductase/Na+-translocating ferredoxin:NAD+ oxidoreductase RnfD subunit